MSHEAYYRPGPNATSRGRGTSRPRKADPLDHSYYIQGDGDTRQWFDPRAIPAAPCRYRAACDECPWTGPWHEGYPDGAKSADADGYAHRQESLGAPGWPRCPECGQRQADDALCDRHAQDLEDSIRKDPWA